EANRHVARLDEQPIALLRPAAEIELDHHTAARDAVATDAPPHPPQEHDGIELVRPRIAEGPARSPLAEHVDDPLQLASGRSEPILRPLAARGATPRCPSTPVRSSRRSRSASSVRDMRGSPRSSSLK